MLSYEQLTLNRCTRDVAVLHVNTNDLASINIIHSTQIKTVHAKNVIKINKILQSKCYHNQFIFFDNGNSGNDDLCDNSLHLRFQGTYKLTNDFLLVLNSILSWKMAPGLVRGKVLC